MMLLKGKSALVTGGTAGLGKAIAVLYAQQGADVAIFGRSESGAQKAMEEMEASRVDPTQKFTYFLVDVSKTKEVKEVIDVKSSLWSHHQYHFSDWVDRQCRTSKLRSF
jgi:3-oxoacyl-[acyl-carrier protein] reductase